MRNIASSAALVPARAVAPGRIVSRELEARGWTQKDLADIMGRPVQVINEIVRGTKQITPETAVELAQAFGTSPELWANLETNYRLNLVRPEKTNDDIARKSRLYSLAPIAEMVRRKWISPEQSIDDLEREVCRFLGISSIDDNPVLAGNFRHSRERGPELNAKIAWVKRVEGLAQTQRVPTFNRSRLREAIPAILAQASRVEDIAKVPELLKALGVRIVFVRHLEKTYIDGAVLCCEDQPIIGLTLRHDRIDAFWFTLMHELAHIVAEHSEIHLDTLYDGGEALAQGQKQEQEANAQARNWLVDQRELAQFVRRVRPYFSTEAVQQFASEQQRHPGIILGQLQYSQLVPYSNMRKFLVKVTPFLGEWLAS